MIPQHLIPPLDARRRHMDAFLWQQFHSSLKSANWLVRLSASACSFMASGENHTGEKDSDTNNRSVRYSKLHMKKSRTWRLSATDLGYDTRRCCQQLEQQVSRGPGEWAHDTDHFLKSRRQHSLTRQPTDLL